MGDFGGTGYQAKKMIDEKYGHIPWTDEMWNEHERLQKELQEGGNKMGREIKFRGYDLDTKKWYYGGYVKFNKVTLCPMGITDEDIKKNEEHLILFQGFSDWNLPAPKHMAEVVPESVGQYTGLKDKNGKEIYEGDIVNVGVINPKSAIIKLHNFAWCYEYQNKYKSIFKFTDNDYFEVIGNIYENPELLVGLK